MIWARRVPEGGRRDSAGKSSALRSPQPDSGGFRPPSTGTDDRRLRAAYIAEPDLGPADSAAGLPGTGRP